MVGIIYARASVKGNHTPLRYMKEKHNKTTPCTCNLRRIAEFEQPGIRYPHKAKSPSQGKMYADRL